MKISLIVILVITIIACGILWYNLDTVNIELHVATTQLEIAQNQVIITNNELTSTKIQLVNTESQLDSTRNELINSENELQSSKTLLVTTENQLEDTKSQLSTVQTQLTTTQAEKTQMLSQYSDLRVKINLRQGEGKDCQEFITPDDEKVSAKVKEITGGSSEDNNELWRDYERLYHWVVNNIEYNNDSYLPYLPQVLGGEIVWTQECWRMPAETLEDEVGDCEDMAVLLASFILSYNNQGFGVWAIGIHNKDSAHLAVAIPVKGNELTIFDPAGNYYTGINGGYLQSFDIDQAVNNWLTHWSSGMPGAEINFVFSYDFYKEFKNSQEFIEWAKTRYS